MYGVSLNTVLWQNVCVTPSNIEAGRYSDINVPLNEALSDKHQVEGEFHGFIICDLYNNIRHSLFQYCHKVCPMLQHVSIDDVFVFIMSDSKVAQQTVKACHNMLN